MSASLSSNLWEPKGSSALTRNWGRLGSVANLALYVLVVTVSIEAVGTLLLWLRWRTELPDGEALWLALFHAVSSYCNAGFDLFAGSGPRSRCSDLGQTTILWGSCRP